MKLSFHLFNTRRFLPLFITQFFGAFNDNAFKNAFLIWFTYDVATDFGMNSAMMVSIAAGLFILPFFLFSATAGQCADKYEKAWLSQKVKQVEIILMVLCGVCFYTKSIYGLLFVLFMMGVQSTFFGPLKYSLLPEHLKKDELMAGNGFIEGGTFISILLGTIFGGLIIRADYGVEILSLCVILFAVVGWLGSCYIPQKTSADPKLKINYNFVTQTWQIIAYAKKNRTVWLAIMGISWFWLIGALFLTQFPTYTKTVLNGDEQIVTLFLTLFSIGIAIGSLLCNRILRGKINGKLIPVGLFGITLMLALFIGFSYQFDALLNGDVMGVMAFIQSGIVAWVIMLSLLMLSVSTGLYIVPLYTIMQHHADSQYLSRIIASNNVMNAFFMVVASVASILAFSTGLDVLQLFACMGVGNIITYFCISELIKGSKKNA